MTPNTIIRKKTKVDHKDKDLIYILNKINHKVSAHKMFTAVVNPNHAYYPLTILFNIY